MGPKLQIQKIEFSSLLAIVGAVSAGSLFVVLPYTVGYFLYFRPSAMALFSVVDLYQFGAFHLLFVSIGSAVLVVVILSATPNPRLSLKSAAFILVVSIFPLLLLPLSSFMLIFCFVVTFFFVTLWRAYNSQRVVLSLILFFFFELTLFQWGVARGFLVDHSLAIGAVDISIKSETKRVKLVFLGSEAVLYMTPQRRLIAAKLNGDATIDFGVIGSRKWMGCLTQYGICSIIDD